MPLGQGSFGGMVVPIVSRNKIIGALRVYTANPWEFSPSDITLFQAVGLVIFVVYIFLQNVRSTLIPTLAVPVSLIGTFAVFPLLGFSINTLSLLGLVLAIGIVVDDAIVVVEAVAQKMEKGMKPKEATILSTNS